MERGGSAPGADSRGPRNSKDLQPAMCLHREEGFALTKCRRPGPIYTCQCQPDLQSSPTRVIVVEDRRIQSCRLQNLQRPPAPAGFEHLAHRSRPSPSRPILSGPHNRSYSVMTPGEIKGHPVYDAGLRSFRYQVPVRKAEVEDRSASRTFRARRVGAKRSQVT